MSDDSFENAPDHGFLAEPGIPATAVPDSFSQELAENPRIAKLSSEVRRLYAWLGILTGISVLSLGLLAGFAFWLKQQQDRVQQQQAQVQEQLAGLNAYKAEVERLKTLDSRINTIDNQTRSLTQNMALLNQQIAKELPTQLKGVENDVASVKAALQRVQPGSVIRDQLTQPLQNLQRGQQEQKNPGNSLPPTQQPQQPRR